MLIPGPDTRVVELRVHGVQGTTPHSLVDAVAAVDVAGDGLGRIVRPADRLRRPGPGPVLQADGRPITRVVEGYVWGAMTSGGWAKATWAVLFPFSLANAAHWMLPPVPERNTPAHLLGIGLRSLLRLAALLLTVLLVAQTAVVTLDLLAAQCLAPGAACLADVVPVSLRTVPWARTAVGLAPVALLIFVLARLSTVDWRVDRPEPDGDGPEPSALPGAHVATDPDAPVLRALHVVAAFGAVTAIALGGPLGPLTAPGAHGVAITVAWVLGLVLVGAAALGVMLLDDPTGGAPHRGGRGLRAALGRKRRLALVLGSGALLVVAAGLVDRLPARLPGVDVGVQVLAALLVLVCVLFGVLLVPAALLARPAWAALPRGLRPWAGGWMAAPVLVLAGLLGGGFGAGVALTARWLLGGGLPLPIGYCYLTLLWGVAGVLGLPAGFLVLATTGVVRWSSLRRDEEWGREASLLHPGRARDVELASKAWWRARWERNHGHHVVLILTAVLVAGAVPAIALRLRRIEPAAWTRPFSAFGVLVLGLLAVTLLRAVWLAARRPQSGRRLGIMADIASYWPREAHPVVPPCYALKVVPDLVARTREHLEDRGTRVVLTGHGQGGLLVAVAAARLLELLPPEDRERVGLLTAGSQLQWAYPRAFPAVVPHSSLAALAGGLDGRWRALCRGTDPLGGAVTTWGRQVFDGMLLGVGYLPDGTEGALPPAVRGPNGALVLGGDHWLPDPARGPLPGRRWASGVCGHADYTADPEWDRAVAIAAGLSRVDSPEAPTNGTTFALPTARRATTLTTLPKPLPQASQPRSP